MGRGLFETPRARRLKVFSKELHFMRTPRHLRGIIDLIKRNRDEDRQTIMLRAARLRNEDWHLGTLDLNVPQTVDKVLNSVDFAVEVWLLRRFNTAEMLTLRDLQQLGDFVIQPTDNILEHLLKSLQRSEIVRRDDQNLGFVAPTQRRKEPQIVKAYRERFQRSLQSRELMGIDPNAGRLLPVGSKRALVYDYWLSQLVVLEYEFENYLPRTFRQFVRASLRYHEWTIYWAITVIILLLALISTLAGVMCAIVGGFAL
ncbi:hypothetical protein BDP55DRAFT_634590 [Colletotrichum godetiae]|uniref:Uncharacterized protein n=1 Tax=Colletotrichum godetiae TaxID=1209918 RepID=A0AAJ0EV35_9PEZI|nr:uncharacterized protein BDP55DRAFT_634590 [Colletotrichum godetiae]KAK1672834.1 hypothetical protein BDP55DRAFT_634590 [Colletotrichum godetiae]